MAAEDLVTDSPSSGVTPTRLTYSSSNFRRQRSHTAPQHIGLSDNNDTRQSRLVCSRLTGWTPCQKEEGHDPRPLHYLSQNGDLLRLRP